MNHHEPPDEPPFSWLPPLLSPRSIAVIGASDNEASHTGRTLANLLRTGYTARGGAVYPVNTRSNTVQGIQAYPSVLDIAEPVESAYVLVNASAALSVVEQCVSRGVRSIIVCSSGFAELGPAGNDAQAALRETARAGGARLLGPNCIGVLNPVDGFVAVPTSNIVSTMTAGSVTVVSQSGGMGVNVFNRAQAQRIGIRALISTGNEADLGIAELIQALVGDPLTQVIALVVEQLRDGDRFAQAIAAAHAAGKPVVALKVGRSDAGRRSALTHTGALAGTYRIFSDVLAQLGVVEVSTVDELIGAAHLLSRFPVSRGRRLAVVSPSGGECSYVADRATDRGLELPALSEATAEELSRLMRLGIPGNPLDPTGAIIGDPALLERLLGVLTADDGFDMLAFTIATWGPADAERLLPGFIAAARASSKPVVISEWSARGMTEVAEDLLRHSGVVTFNSSDEAIDALAAWARFAAPASNSGVGGELVAVGVEPTAATSEVGAKVFLSRHGIPVSHERLVPSPPRSTSGLPPLMDLCAAADAIGWPIVAKVIAAGVLHKSELGLVAVGLQDPTALERALITFEETVQSNRLTPLGILVSAQYDGLELIVGGIRDDTFGPVVMVGGGGVFAEGRDDTAFRRCPIDIEEAEAMIHGLHLGSVLRGARGVTYDVVAAASVVARFSSVFARAVWIDTMDLNPVIIGALPKGGAVVVDAIATTR